MGGSSGRWSLPKAQPHLPVRFLLCLRFAFILGPLPVQRLDLAASPSQAIRVCSESAAFISWGRLFCQLTWLGSGPSGTRVLAPFCLVDSSACLDSCVLWIPRTAQWTEGWSLACVCVCVVFSAFTGYNVDWKHAAVLWVRDERRGSIVSGVA